jgi:hypothetical protein
MGPTGTKSGPIGLASDLGRMIRTKGTLLWVYNNTAYRVFVISHVELGIEPRAVNALGVRNFHASSQSGITYANQPLLGNCDLPVDEALSLTFRLQFQFCVINFEQNRSSGKFQRRV